MVAEVQAPSSPRAPWAKQRILETADELFYAEGIRVVGVDRLISQSSVTKATFYKHYGSKDTLVLTYIEGRHEAMAARFSELSANAPDPLSTLHALVETVSSDIRDKGFRGCAFANAAAEFPDAAHPVRAVVTKHRDWVTELLSDIFAELGHTTPGSTADDVLIAIDGAHIGGYAGDPIAATTALQRTVDRVVAAA